MANVPFNSTITGPNIENAARLFKFSTSNVQGGAIGTTWAAGLYLINVSAGVLTLTSLGENGVVTRTGSFTVGHIVKASSSGELIDAGIVAANLTVKSGSFTKDHVIAADVNGALVDSGLDKANLDLSWTDFIIADE